MERRPRILIVGAGIAGAACAWHLARRGAAVALFDAAASPDAHSSGRNAAILRTAIPHAPLHGLAVESAAFYRQPAAGFAAVPLVQGVGLILAAPRGEQAEALGGWLANRACATPSRRLSATELQASHPYADVEGLESWRFDQEGVLDVHAIHQGFLHGALATGATLHLRQEVTALERQGNRLTGLHLADGTHHRADAILLATGPWADRLLRPHGLRRLMTPRRRHLLVTAPNAAIDPRAPVLWIVGKEEFYCRPESGGLLLSACDSEVTTAEEGETLAPEQREAAIEAALRQLPGLADSGIAHAWAGMRTFQESPDFLLGADRELGGLHWAAALGGHGISTAYAVGRQVADGIMRTKAETPLLDVPGFAGA